jgi:hypothetical protein
LLHGWLTLRKGWVNVPATGGDAVSGIGADSPFKVAVEPRDDRYDPDDEGWHEQVATLQADLDARVGTVHRAYPVGGAKGAAGQLIITLGSAAVFGAVGAACVPGWGVTGTGVSKSAVTALLSVGGAAATTLTIKEGVVHKKVRRISSSDPAHLVQT